VPKHPAAGLIQHKTPQPIILGKGTPLLPDRLTGRWGNPADDYVAHFSFRVATYHMNDLG
jgi:hypothetical protein